MDDDKLKQFDLSQKRIDEINETTHTVVEFMEIMSSFANWVSANNPNIDLKEVVSIYEDYVRSNRHIIKRISKVMPPP